MGVMYGCRPSAFLLDPDRLAVALDLACAAIGRKGEVSNVDDILRSFGSKVQPVVLVGKAVH